MVGFNSCVTLEDLVYLELDQYRAVSSQSKILMVWERRFLFLYNGIYMYLEYSDSAIFWCEWRAMKLVPSMLLLEFNFSVDRKELAAIYIHFDHNVSRNGQPNKHF